MNNAGYQIHVDNMTSSNWDDLVNRFEDAHIYQTWSYGVVRWGQRNLSHLVLKQNEKVLSVAQLRIIRPRFFKGGIAYLRWGPLCQLRGQEPQLEVVRPMALALHEEYVQKRRLFLRILPNAFEGSPGTGSFKDSFSQFRQEPQGTANARRTFLLDLTPPLDELRERLDQKWRNQLNGAERNDLTIIEGSGAGEFQMFSDLYQAMWRRKKFDNPVDVHEFGLLCEALPPSQKIRILICLHKGVPVNGIVCAALGHTGIYLLGATNDAGLNTKGAYLLQWLIIKWLKENGYRYYDLGGINPEANPGVYHFKRGLAGADLTRIAPLESCQNPLSSLCILAADIVHAGLGSSIRNWWGLRFGSSMAAKQS